MFFGLRPIDVEWFMIHFHLHLNKSNQALAPGIVK